MTTPRDILKLYNVHPTKKLGQSFLVDVNIIQKIAAAAHPVPGDVVVEIGAGIGVLTASLAKRASKLIAVELDARLVKILNDRFGATPSVQVHAGDVLKFDYSAVSDKYHTKLKVIGNVPYNISSPVVFHLLKHRTVINNFTLMLQKEVVERLVGMPGTKATGSLDFLQCTPDVIAFLMLDHHAFTRVRSCLFSHAGFFPQAAAFRT